MKSSDRQLFALTNIKYIDTGNCDKKELKAGRQHPTLWTRKNNLRSSCFNMTQFPLQTIFASETFVKICFLRKYFITWMLLVLGHTQ